MKNQRAYIRYWKLVILASALISILSGCALEPKKPYVIIEKSYGNLPGQDYPQWRYVYVGSNGQSRCFGELTDKYNIGDTIK